MFQSPNGVQIALQYSITFRAISFVSITKRCTDCFEEEAQKTLDKEKFQSPNGVQIALAITSSCFYPNGVSITKRCTDCFILILMRYHGQIVSITKRCTDCLVYALYARRQRLEFQSPNGVQIALQRTWIVGSQ